MRPSMTLIIESGGLLDGIPHCLRLVKRDCLQHLLQIGHTIDILFRTGATSTPDNYTMFQTMVQKVTYVGKNVKITRQKSALIHGTFPKLDQS